MAEKVSLKILKCPSCGANLKAQNTTDAITCVYCNNTVVPVTEPTVTAPKNEAGGFSGVLKVEGIKTSSSALAYIEQFFEDYDWEAFAYAQTLSIAEIDKLADSLKVSSADDKNTWFACFKAAYVPFINKLAGCNKILASIVEEYKKDNLDAYSKFDAYKRISSMINMHRDGIVTALEKIATNASKYGASDSEISSLHTDIENVKGASFVETYNDIESIPQIRSFINEKNARISQTLAAKGINAEYEYANAVALINERRFVEALNTLLRLEGYSNANTLIEKIDKYFLISDVLEIDGKLYYFKKDQSEYSTYCLYPTVNGTVGFKPIIRNISNIITNYADMLYYISSNNRLKRYNLATNVEEKLYDKRVDKKFINIYKRRAFLLADKSADYSSKKELVELNLSTGAVRTILEDVKAIVSCEGNKIIYTVSEKINGNSYETQYRTLTNILDVDLMTITPLGDSKLSVEGFMNNYVVYTKLSPNEYNKSLYIKSLNTAEPERLIEQNIYSFCDIIENKLFYYIGNSKNQSLITINCDGTERKEWRRFISKILFEQGGWLYFIRRAGYNAVLCKSRLDGSKYSIIAGDIDEFIDIKNGYLYYINSDATLVKVRMDGSNLQELCDDVETVLSVKENKIIFVSIDDKISTGTLEFATTKLVKSIYAVDFSGSGKIKLAYNVTTAKEYDENTVYYVSAAEAKTLHNPTEKPIQMLHRLNVETNSVDVLLNLEPEKEESGLSKFTIAMIIMAVLFFLSLIFFACEITGFAILLLLGGFGALMYGIVVKFSDNEQTQ